MHTFFNDNYRFKRVDSKHASFSAYVCSYVFSHTYLTHHCISLSLLPYLRLALEIMSVNDRN